MLSPAIAALLLAFAQSAAAQSTDYPSRAGRLIVAFPPGGATDILARLVSSHLEKTWKQPFPVENRPGGLTQIGTEAVVKAHPDGYTLRQIWSHEAP